MLIMQGYKGVMGKINAKMGIYPMIIQIINLKTTTKL
jgi:hypothetical protein